MASRDAATPAAHHDHDVSANPRSCCGCCSSRRPCHRLPVNMHLVGMLLIWHSRAGNDWLRQLAASLPPLGYTYTGLQSPSRAWQRLSSTTFTHTPAATLCQPPGTPRSLVVRRDAATTAEGNYTFRQGGITEDQPRATRCFCGTCTIAKDETHESVVSCRFGV